MNSTNVVMFKILASVFVMVVAILGAVRILGGIDNEQFTDTSIKVGAVFVILLIATWVVSLIQGPGETKKK